MIGIGGFSPALKNAIFPDAIFRELYTFGRSMSQIGYSEIEGVAVKGAVEAAFTFGEEGGGRRSCDVEGICRRWRLPHSTGRRNISRTTCVDPTPLSSGLHLCPPTLSPAALCPSVSPLITGDYTRLCVRSRCDNIWLQIDHCMCGNSRSKRDWLLRQRIALIRVQFALFYAISCPSVCNKNSFLTPYL